MGSPPVHEFVSVMLMHTQGSDDKLGIALPLELMSVFRVDSHKEGDKPARSTK
jgi:hypothetical protein